MPNRQLDNYRNLLQVQRLSRETEQNDQDRGVKARLQGQTSNSNFPFVETESINFLPFT